MTMSSATTMAMYVAALPANTHDGPTACSSRPPTAGPITREPFICAEFSEIAAGRFWRLTMLGSSALYAGA